MPKRDLIARANDQYTSGISTYQNSSTVEEISLLSNNQEVCQTFSSFPWHSANDHFPKWSIFTPFTSTRNNVFNTRLNKLLRELQLFVTHRNRNQQTPLLRPWLAISLTSQFPRRMRSDVRISFDATYQRAENANYQNTSGISTDQNSSIVEEISLLSNNQ